MTATIPALENSGTKLFIGLRQPCQIAELRHPRHPRQPCPNQHRPVVASRRCCIVIWNVASASVCLLSDLESGFLISGMPGLKYMMFIASPTIVSYLDRVQ
jgi:hypothetical protein